MKNILITGGAGFIGSSLADRLLSEGKNIICVDNFSDYYDISLKEKNILQASLIPAYKLYRTDIEDKDALEKIFQENQIDAIVHLAARAGVRPSIKAPADYVKTNILGTVNLLDLMKKYNITKMVFASSSSVYGNCKADKFHENLKVSEPISPYAATKSACEQLCYTYSHLYNIQIICLRFFTVYGPRQRPDLAINKFARLIEEGLSIPMFGDGSTMRDYTYIDDIVSGIEAALNYNQTNYEIINIGGGSPVTLHEMITTLEKVLKIKAKINKLPMQPGDVDKTIADINKAKLLLNYCPQTSFEEGIKKFMEWKNENFQKTKIS